MIIKPLSCGDESWEVVAQFAYDCSWSAGKSLAKLMRDKEFLDWERVFAAYDGSSIAGYCTFTGKDCIPDVTYSPYIGYMFIDERFRGNRLSGKLIEHTLLYAKELGYDKVYIVSDHVNLYEKYGFEKIDEKPAPWNPDTMETIFMHVT